MGKKSIVKKSGSIVKKAPQEAASKLMGGYEYVPGYVHSAGGLPFYVPGHLHYTPGAGGWAMHDHEKEYIVVAELPGISRKNIDIKITPGRAEICVTGEEKGKEVHYAQLCRAVDFGEEAIPGKAKAAFKNGLLELKIPKKAPKPREKAHTVKVE